LGIIQLWHEDVKDKLSALGFPLNLNLQSNFTVLLFEGCKVAVNLVTTDHAYLPDQLIGIQESFDKNGIYLVHLWQDIWQNRHDQVLGRIRSITGRNQRIHGRKTKITVITQKQADEFLEAHHLQGTASAKYRFALTAGDDLLVVACFSNLRYMKKGGPVYRSAELIRFATCTGFTVTGGFSKLLKYFIELYRPDDIMSYADRDWSLGKAYEQAGFQLSEITPPSEIWLEEGTGKRFFAHRLPRVTDERPDARRYRRIFNTGNLKYILYLH